MPYTPVTYSHITDVFLKDEVFRRADMFLHDVYCMFTLPRGSDGDAGGNWTIALTLLCVVDGISCHVYPTSLVSKQEQRFKRLIREKLYWPEGWWDKGKSAAVLYTKFRNPLAHGLAVDRLGSAYPPDFLEPAVGKWGDVPVPDQDIKAIDARQMWNDDWPTLSVQDYNGGKRLKLTCAALYWTVKNMVNTLAADTEIVNKAAAFHSKAAAEARE